MDNLEVQSFLEVDYSEMKLPSIAVFKNPLDLPNKFVARLFDLENPTNVVVIKDTLEEIRQTIPPNFIKIKRTLFDHPTVVEVWL